jgi:siroheme synthase-like protein
MSYYPVNLNLKGKLCLVAGAGEIAVRKVEMLLSFKATVKVVAPEVNAKIKSWADAGKITLCCRDFKPEDIKGAFLVIAATDSALTNSEIAAFTRKKHILINVVDSPQQCDFILPSVVKRGDLVISICSGGKAPALSKKLRQELEKVLPNELEELVAEAGSWREALKIKVKDLNLRKAKLEALWQDE